MCRYAFAQVVVMAIGLPAAGQGGQLEQNFRVWFAYFGDHPFGNSRWGVHLEGQIRRRWTRTVAARCSAPP